MRIEDHCTNCGLGSYSPDNCNQCGAKRWQPKIKFKIKQVRTKKTRLPKWLCGYLWAFFHWGYNEMEARRPSGSFDEPKRRGGW